MSRLHRRPFAYYECQASYIILLMCSCCCVTVCVSGSLVKNPSRTGLLSRFKLRPILFFMNKICVPAQGSWTRQDRPHCSQRIGRCHLPSCNEDFSSFTESRQNSRCLERGTRNTCFQERREVQCRQLSTCLSNVHSLQANGAHTGQQHHGPPELKQSSLRQAAWFPL